MNLEDMPLGRMINQSLIQTAGAGMTYAVIPKPWVREWQGWFTRNEDRAFKWFLYCGSKEHGWDMDKMPCVDGDVYVCLVQVHVCEYTNDRIDHLTVPHNEPCGYEALLPKSLGFGSVDIGDGVVLSGEIRIKRNDTQAY